MATTEHKEYKTANLRRGKIIEGRIMPEFFRACLKIPWSPVFVERVGWRGATEGAYPPAVCDRGATKPGDFFRENPPGGGSFV